MADRASHYVRGYHGTTKSRAHEILSTGFKEPKRGAKPDYRWLGRGAYFFQECLGLADKWAKQLSDIRSPDDPIVIAADIDLSHCLDLIDEKWHDLLRDTWIRLKQQREKDGQPFPEQQGLQIVDDKVVVRPLIKPGSSSGDEPGMNYVDFEVIETAIKMLERDGTRIDSVRAVFLEGGALYSHSWIFDGAHIAIAVRPPYDAARILPGQIREGLAAGLSSGAG